jgi:hypothetical protein
MTTDRYVAWAGTLAAIAVALTAWSVSADPVSPQCWGCLRVLAMQLPAANPQEDPTYEQGLSPGSVLPSLAQCSLDDSEIAVLRRVIKVFSDAQDDGGVAYVDAHLKQIRELSADDRAKLLNGARQSLDTTWRYLVNHNCRILLRAMFDEGGGRDWILHMIEQGQTRHED